MNGHENLIRSLPHFFIRKVSPNAKSVIDLDLSLAESKSTTRDELKEAKKKTDLYLSSLVKYRLRGTLQQQFKLFVLLIC